MSYLFEVRGTSVVPDALVLMVPEVKAVWDRHEDKGISLKELAYCEFMVSQQRSNPFYGYPESSRSEVIIASLFPDEVWVPDGVIRACMGFIERVQRDGSPTYGYYMAARRSAEGMRDFFLTVDLNERNDKGMPIYKPKDITGALIDTEKVISNLDGLHRKVLEELYESVKVRAGKEVSPFADPKSLL